MQPKYPSLSPYPVATLRALSRHKVSLLCRDKEFSVATGHLRKPVATGSLGTPACVCTHFHACRHPVVCTSASVAHTMPFLSRHHLQCHDLKLQMGSSPLHLVPCTFFFFFFCPTYCKTNRKFPYCYKICWNQENSAKCIHYTKGV